VTTEDDGMTSEIMYHGKNREVFEKVIRNKFGGDDSVKSKTAIISYLAMFDLMEVIEPTVVSGETAMRASEAISENFSNVITSLVVNLFPSEIRDDVLKYILMDMVTTIPGFFKKCLETQKEEEERIKNGLKN
jgi:hypothetical protein